MLGSLYTASMQIVAQFGNSMGPGPVTTPNPASIAAFSLIAPWNALENSAAALGIPSESLYGNP